MLGVFLSIQTSCICLSFMRLPWRQTSVLESSVSPRSAPPSLALNAVRANA